MINVYDTINQLEQDLKKTKEYLDLKSSFEAVKEDAKSYEFFKEIRRAQEKFQKKQESGSISENDVKELQKFGEKANDYPKINKLIEQEQVMYTFLDEIYQTLVSPVQKMYEE